MADYYNIGDMKYRLQITNNSFCIEAMGLDDFASFCRNAAHAAATLGFSGPANAGQCDTRETGDLAPAAPPSHMLASDRRTTNGHPMTPCALYGKTSNSIDSDLDSNYGVLPLKGAEDAVGENLQASAYRDHSEGPQQDELPRPPEKSGSPLEVGPAELEEQGGHSLLTCAAPGQEPAEENAETDSNIKGPEQSELPRPPEVQTYHQAAPDMQADRLISDDLTTGSSQDNCDNCSDELAEDERTLVTGLSACGAGLYPPDWHDRPADPVQLLQQRILDKEEDAHEAPELPSSGRCHDDATSCGPMPGGGYVRPPGMGPRSSLLDGESNKMNDHLSKAPELPPPWTITGFSRTTPIQKLIDERERLLDQIVYGEVDGLPQELLDEWNRQLVQILFLIDEAASPA